MKYAAQRIRTGEWLTRDLPLSGAERTRDLSGPGTISATIDPGLRDVMHDDGLHVVEDWATAIYAINDDGRITQGGLVVPATSFEEDGTTLTIGGFACYPQGYPYTSAYNWGPFVDPIKVYRDHWDWLQRQARSDLGIKVVGAEFSSVRIGDNEEPYALSWVDEPDLGGEMDSLAEQTPFDYQEEHEWADEGRERVSHRIRIGHPRLGSTRNDLRFVQDENMAARITGATNDSYANEIIGIGNGEGVTMIRSTAAVDDGRLRRIGYITDKTITRQAHMDDVVRRTLRKVGATLDITEVTVIEHRNAPISAINLGDDIFVQSFLRSYGPVEMWVRVLGITEADDNPGVAVLATQRSSAFVYNEPVVEDVVPPIYITPPTESVVPPAPTTPVKVRWVSRTATTPTAFALLMPEGDWTHPNINGGDTTTYTLDTRATDPLALPVRFIGNGASATYPDATRISRVALTDGRVGFRYSFEDGGDGDFNDNVVDVWTTGSINVPPVVVGATYGEVGTTALPYTHTSLNLPAGTQPGDLLLVTMNVPASGSTAACPDPRMTQVSTGFYGGANTRYGVWIGYADSALTPIQINYVQNSTFGSRTLLVLRGGTIAGVQQPLEFDPSRFGVGTDHGGIPAAPGTGNGGLAVYLARGGIGGGYGAGNWPATGLYTGVSESDGSYMLTYVGRTNSAVQPATPAAHADAGDSYIGFAIGFKA